MRRSTNGYNRSISITSPERSRTRMNDGGSSSPDQSEQAAVTTRPPRPQPLGSGGFYTPWAVFEERVRTGPYGLSHFPFQPYSPVHILILDTGTIGTGEVDPALPMFIRNFSPPRIRSEWHLRLQREAEPEEPGLTEEEFRKAMKKMKRHVHRPHNQGRRSWRRGPFSSRRAGGGEAEDDHKEQSKDCAVCLETFGVNQEVMTLPCNHMFHQDCIVPWVRRRGQCPVCRLDLCDRPQQQRHQETENSALAVQRGGVNGNGGDEVIWDDELVHLIRAMEEALNWINLTR